MKYSSLVLALIACFLLSACERVFNGSMEVLQAIEFLAVEDDSEDEDNDYDSDALETVRLEPGSYRTKLIIPSKTKIKLEFKVNDSTKTVAINIPEDSELPEENGNFNFSASEIGQNFGVAGVINTVVTESEDMRDWEDCQYRERRCYWNGNTRVCYDETRWGEQNVEYFYRYKDAHLVIDMLGAAAENLAQYVGDEHVREKIYTYKGRCR